MGDVVECGGCGLVFALTTPDGKLVPCPKCNGKVRKKE